MQVIASATPMISSSVVSSACQATSRLLVRDPPFTHRLSERREHAKPALQRDTLLDGALGHPQPFGAVVAEGSEPRVTPEPERPHEHREVAECVVPLCAQAGEAA